MAFPTNKKITEDQINKLVSESRNPINPLSMAFTYEYVTSLVPLNWNDLLFAIENDFLAYHAAIDHALIEVQQNESSPMEVMELACTLKSEAEFHDICQLVNKLATLRNSGNYSDSKEKFLYVSLSWVCKHKDDYCNPIEVVDILCDDIDYPDEVKSLISFMPAQVSTTDSADHTIEGLYDRLLRYLEKQQHRWV